MTIAYVDRENGDDSTGDGSYSNPYLRIRKADDGLSGGDEIRVAKTTITTLSGTLAFVEGSDSVTTSADQTSVVSAGDMISKNTAGEGWWIVESVASGAITLDRRYYGADATTTGYHMAVATARAETLATDGTSTASRIKCTGGWDLSTQTQDGLTSIYAGSASGLTGNSDYAEISHFVVTTGLSTTWSTIINGDNVYAHDMYLPGVDVSGGAQVVGDNIIAEDIVFSGGGDRRQLDVQGSDGLYSDISIFSNTYAAVNINSGASRNIFESPIIRTLAAGLYNVGFYFTSNAAQNIINNADIDGAESAFKSYQTGEQTWVNSPTMTDCYYGFHANESVGGFHIVDPTFSGGSSLYRFDNTASNTVPAFYTIDSGVHSRRWSRLTVESDTADARSGKCMKFTPNTTTPNVPAVELGVTKVASAASDLTLSAYIKRGATYAGDVHLFAVQNHVVVSDFEKQTLTTSYAQKSVVVSSSDLVVDEYLTLFVTTSGVLDSVYIDDFSYSQ